MRDVLAGLTVMVFMIPESIAYANLAGLPAIYGLYTSIVPLLVYCSLCSSRHLQVGPVALISIMLGSLLRPLQLDPASYVALAVALSVFVGVVLLLFAALRLTFLVEYLSHPVLIGFCSAAGFVIILSQVHEFLGMPPDAHHHKVFSLLWHILTSLRETNPAALGIGLLGIVVMVGSRRIHRLLPGPLLCMAAGALVLRLTGAHVDVLDAVPPSLPGFRLPNPYPQGSFWEQLSNGPADLHFLFAAGLSLALVALAEAISVARTMAIRGGYRIDPHKEVRALGMANLLGGFFQAFPATGSLSKSAVNLEAGAVSPRAGMVAAALVTVSLFFLGPVLVYIPKASLAAIVIVAVSRLVDVAAHRRSFRVKPADGWVGVGTFVATLLLGVQQGILIGVAVSFATFLGRSSRPNLIELGRSEHGWGPGGTPVAGVHVLRVEGPLYFGSASHFERLCFAYLIAHEDGSLVLDASAINDLDISGEHSLRDVLTMATARGQRFAVVAPQAAVAEVLRRSGFLDLIGNFSPDVESALNA